MPQLSPLFWMIFPFFIFLVVICMILNAYVLDICLCKSDYTILMKLKLW